MNCAVPVAWQSIAVNSQPVSTTSSGNSVIASPVPSGNGKKIDSPSARLKSIGSPPWSRPLTSNGNSVVDPSGSVSLATVRPVGACSPAWTEPPPIASSDPTVSTTPSRHAEFNRRVIGSSRDHSVLRDSQIVSQPNSSAAFATLCLAPSG